MEDSRKVSHEEGMELARHYEIPFLETSAKSSINVESSFVTMANEIKKNLQNKAGATTAGGADKKIKFGQGQFLHSQSEETAESQNSDRKKKNSSCCQ